MVRKGFIINDDFVEDDNGTFFAFDTVADLKDFLDNNNMDNEGEEMECKVCGASNTEVELFNNNGKCTNCEMPWNFI